MRPLPDTPSDLRRLYPPIEPYDSGYVRVDSGHRVYWELCGNPHGQPALFLHGGPGGGCSPLHRRLFDPTRWRIVLFDQRGCGRSLPHASVVSNTTAFLISDIETLRRFFSIDRWLVLGGSWGSTLALLYAQAHPACVRALVLRGVFTARQSELDWLYRTGASHLFPAAWQRLLAPILPNEREDLLAAYHEHLTCGDPWREAEVARAWCAWEDEISTSSPASSSSATVVDHAAWYARARLETHYFTNRSFIEEGQVLADAPRLRDIPGIIVQGRWDMVTPLTTAWELHRAWPGSKLWVIPDAGHATVEPGIPAALVTATDAFAA